jgi:hypothetical protein
MNTIESLEMLESHSSITPDILLAVYNATENTNEFKDVLRMSLSRNVNFGIRKLPQHKNKHQSLGHSWWRVLKNLLLGLQTRQLVDKEAQKNIEDFANLCSVAEAKWAFRIIKQDLNLHLTPVFVNKVLGPVVWIFNIPQADDIHKDQDLRGKWCVMPKIMGIRCIAEMPSNKGKVRLLNSKGQEMREYSSIQEKLQEINDGKNPALDLILDGVIDLQNFDDEEPCLKYFIVDGAPQFEWNNPSQSFKQRFTRISQIIKTGIREVSGAISRLGMVEMFETDNPDFQRAIKHGTDFGIKGYEGAIYRKSSEIPSFQRNSNFIKIETFSESSAKVVKAFAGGGKNSTRLGYIECLTDGGVPFSLDFGFPYALKKQYWQDYQAKKMPQRLIYRCFGVENGVPITPIFKEFVNA